MIMQPSKVCPECGHEFNGKGWEGIDAHWRAEHAQVMRYEEAWPLIHAGEYTPKKVEQQQEKG
jgi:hypothetical protein